MYQAADYQSLNSQGLICLQLILKSRGWEWLTVTVFSMVFDRLATTTEHGIYRLQELCGTGDAADAVASPILRVGMLASPIFSLTFA